MRAHVVLFSLAALASCNAPPPAPTVTSASASASPSAPPSASAPAAPLSPDERAAALHRSSIVVDTHNDITSIVFDQKFDLAHPNGTTQTDLPRMKAGGITAEFFSIYVDRKFVPEGHAARRALDLIDVTYQQIERHPDDLVLATSVEDIRRAKKDGKIAVLMGIEGGHAIENSLYALRDFYRLGVRYMTLTHSNTNDWADSAGVFAPEPPRHHGLSPFGEQVVKEMQRIGMLVDVSHVSDETFDDVMRVATCPVIASHSSMRALANMPRNLTDDMLRALAKNGGVVMINFWSAFLDPKNGAFLAQHRAEIEAIRKKYEKDPAEARAAVQKLAADSGQSTPLSVLVDHIAHAIEVAGADHVGLGSDFDGVPMMPEGLEGIDGLPRITRELVRHGYDDDTIRKVLGESFLRAFAAAEACARATKTTLSGDGAAAEL